MASLDFVFLAEYAKLEPGSTITAVGAGIKGIRPTGDGPAVQLFVAGAVDRVPGEAEASMTITIQPETNEYSISQTISMDSAPEGLFATTLFAIAVSIPITGSGKYNVLVAVDEQLPTAIDLWVDTEDASSTLPDGA